MVRKYEDALVDSFVDRVGESLKSRPNGASRRGSRGHKYLAILLIAVGAVVLLPAINISWGVVLPMAAIGIGVVMLSSCKRS